MVSYNKTGVPVLGIRIVGPWHTWHEKQIDSPSGGSDSHETAAASVSRATIRLGSSYTFVTP